jgi:hypothetical protein
VVGLVFAYGEGQPKKTIHGIVFGFVACLFPS